MILIYNRYANSQRTLFKQNKQDKWLLIYKINTSPGLSMLAELLNCRTGPRSRWTASSEFGTYCLCEQRRSSESRGTFRQKARSLGPLNGWACAVKICHDGMLEDTNSLDAAQIKTLITLKTIVLKFCHDSIAKAAKCMIQASYMIVITPSSAVETVLP